MWNISKIRDYIISDPVASRFTTPALGSENIFPPHNLQAARGVQIPEGQSQPRALGTCSGPRDGFGSEIII